MRRNGSVRVLGDRDLDAVRHLLARDPIANVMVAARVEQSGLEPWRLGAEMWGYVGEGGDSALSSLCFSGANLVPVGADDTALDAYADRARRQGRRCSSIVGEAPGVLRLWHRLHRYWGEPRDVRENQPLMVLAGPPLIEPARDVRAVRDEELDLLLPAAIAMYTEEIGFSPVGNDGGALYRARVAELISDRRAYAVIRNNQIVFKAEIGAAAGDICQVQGVWVEPSRRGLGLGARCTAAVVEAARRDVAPVVSLYVNEHNEPARRAYERVGFQTVGTFASVLF